MIEGNALVPIAVPAYKHNNVNFFGAIELNIETNSIVWSFDALSEGLEASEIEGEDILEYTGFRPASVQRLDNNNTVISGWSRIVVVDENGEIIQIYTHPRFNDIHETKFTDNDTILVASTGADEILEFNKEFEVIWRWKMWEHIDDTPNHYYPSEIPEADDIRNLAFGPDYRFHINHAQYIDDDLILASALNHGIFVINKETDKIVNQFTELDECHNPYLLEDGTIVVAESGKDRIVKVDDNVIDEVMFEGEMNFVKDADKVKDDIWIISDTKNSRVLYWKKDEDNPRAIINLPEKSLPYEADYLTGDKTNA